MAKCGYSYDEMLAHQRPFTLSTNDLLMISHKCQAKIISISDLASVIATDLEDKIRDRVRDSIIDEFNEKINAIKSRITEIETRVKNIEMRI